MPLMPSSGAALEAVQSSSPGALVPRGDVPVAENICTVLSNEWVNSEYKHLVLSAPPVALAVLPGQFFHLRCPGVADEQPFLRRPMSVYGIDRARRRIEFLYKVQGIGTRGLATLTSGMTLDAFGPVGNGFTFPTGAHHIVLVARGVGLATLAPIANEAQERGIAITAVLSARSAAFVMSADVFLATGADVITVTDEDGSSQVAEVEHMLREIHQRRSIDLFITCGSNRLLSLLQRVGHELGISGQVAVEQHMGCSLGMCFACVLPFRKKGTDRLTYRRVCYEGPVFPIEDTVTWSI